MLVLNEDIKRQIIEHAVHELPYEACGLFSANSGSNTIACFYPMENVAKSEMIYQLDPLEMMKGKALLMPREANHWSNA